MEIYFLRYRQVEKCTKVNMLKMNGNRHGHQSQIINTYLLEFLVLSKSKYIETGHYNKNINTF